jgi:hypothetical protein
MTLSASNRSDRSLSAASFVDTNTRITGSPQDLHVHNTPNPSAELTPRTMEMVR